MFLFSIWYYICRTGNKSSVTDARYTHKRLRSLITLWFVFIRRNSAGASAGVSFLKTFCLMLIVIDENLLIVTRDHPFFFQLRKSLYKRRFKTIHKAEIFIHKTQFTIYYKFISKLKK